MIELVTVALSPTPSSNVMVNLQTLSQLVKDASSAIAFMTCCALAAPQSKCPHGHSWSLHVPQKGRQEHPPRPYFWCQAVLLKEKVDGKKRKKRCMAKGRLVDSAPLLRWLPQVSPEKIVLLMTSLHKCRPSLKFVKRHACHTQLLESPSESSEEPSALT